MKRARSIKTSVNETTHISPLLNKLGSLKTSIIEHTNIVTSILVNLKLNVTDIFISWGGLQQRNKNKNTESVTIYHKEDE